MMNSKIMLTTLCVGFIIPSVSFGMKGAPCARKVSTGWYDCLERCEVNDHPCDKACDDEMNTRLLKCRAEGEKILQDNVGKHKRK